MIHAAPRLQGKNWRRCTARMVFDFTQLLDAGVAVNDEIHGHIHLLKDPLLTPEDREHI